MKHPAGTVMHARALLQGPRMSIVASVQMDNGPVVEAHLPDRETAAILPRSVLVAGASRAPTSLLDTLGTIAARMCDGRRARVWTWKDRRFFSFPSWRGVRFVDNLAPDQPRPGGAMDGAVREAAAP